MVRATFAGVPDLPVIIDAELTRAAARQFEPDRFISRLFFNFRLIIPFELGTTTFSGKNMRLPYRATIEFQPNRDNKLCVKRLFPFALQIVARRIYL